MSAWARGFLAALPWVGIAFAHSLAQKARADVHRQWANAVTAALEEHLREARRARREFERLARR